MGIFDRLTATADGSSAAIAERIGELQGQHAKRQREIAELEEETIPAAEAEIGRLLAEQELDGGDNRAGITAAQKQWRSLTETLQGKKLANSQLEAALTVMRKRHDEARLAEIRQQRQSLAETFAKAAKETERLVLAAAVANRRAADAAYAEMMLRNDPLVVAARQHGTMLDRDLEQRQGNRLSQTVQSLEIEHGGTLPSDPGDPGPRPALAPMSGPSISPTVALNFRQR